MNTPETQESAYNEFRRIRLNEKYPVFAQTSQGVLQSSVLLTNVDEIESVAFRLNQLTITGLRRKSVTPFSPKAGYVITQEDLRLETRRQKHNAMGYEKADESAIFYHFQYGILPNEKETRPSDLSPEALAMLRRLRLQLFFPASPPSVKPQDASFHRASAFEARLSERLLSVGGLMINEFYPLETGPLPQAGPLDPDLWEGFHIGFPFAREEFMQIEGRFILLPKTPSREADEA